MIRHICYETKGHNIVLACAGARPNTPVARRFATTKATVGKRRWRFVARRIEGLHDELRRGKPRPIDDERIAALLNTTPCTPSPRMMPACAGWGGASL
jgi:hypothetical protein